MKDVDNPIVDMPTVRRDLYFMMSLLLADKAIGEVPNVPTWTKFFHDNEVRRLMLWIAVSMRSLLDLPGKERGDGDDQNCGEYWCDFPDKELSLTFRQACNSIIHAKEILLYEVSKEEPVSGEIIQQVYTNRLTIRGRYERYRPPRVGTSKQVRSGTRTHQADRCSNDT